MTVRKAIDVLVADQMLTRKKGKGTFLKSDKPKDLTYRLKNITSFKDDIIGLGIKPLYKVLTVEVIEANQKISDMLQLQTDKKVIYILRVLNANNEPVLIDRNYLPYLEFKDILNMNLTDPLFKELTKKFNITLHHSTQVFSYELCGKEETKIFGFPNPCPCFFLECVIYDPNNIPVIAIFSYFRVDKYKLSFTLDEYIQSEISIMNT